jgi:hypothetical protein
MVTRSTASGPELQNDVDIAIATNSYRAARGRSVLISIFDECAFWQDERTARPDVETYRAVLPSLMTLPGAMLVGISTPHKKPGLLFERYKKAFSAEYGVCRSLDVEAFVDPEVVAACLMRARGSEPAIRFKPPSSLTTPACCKTFCTAASCKSGG